MAYTHCERLSAMDASFLAMEDGRAHMHIGTVSIFDAGPLRTGDGGIDFDRILSFIETQLPRVPRFRQKLAWVPGFGQPVWVDDPSFNLSFHVRHTALPPPGDLRQLKRMAGRILSQEFDREKPLWEDWFIDGLEGDRFAVITKVHHCMADGIAGVAMAAMLIGPNPEYEPEPGPDWIPRPAPGDAQLLRDEVRHRVTAPFALLGRQLRRSSASLPGIDSLRQLAGDSLGGTAHSTLNVEIGPHRRFDWTRTRFDEVHELGALAGGTINDVVLATVTGALRGFLSRRGEAVDEIDFRVMVPVSVRQTGEESAPGNRVSGLFVHLPLAETDPWQRLVRIVEMTSELKASDQPRAADVLAQMAELFPPRLMGPFFRLGSQNTAANMVVTNVPGFRVPLYLLGARQLETYPVVPLIANQALGIALMSYDDDLFWGLNADWEAVPDLHDLIERIDAGYAELKAAAPSGD